MITLSRSVMFSVLHMDPIIIKAASEAEEVICQPTHLKFRII